MCEIKDYSMVNLYVSKDMKLCVNQKIKTIKA